MYFWAWCCLRGSFVQRVADGMLQTAVYSQAASYWISARQTTFFTVCASADFFQALLCGSKRRFPAWYYSQLSLSLPPLPQPAQKTSYFKGQDGRLSQVTSFYRSTRRTSALPSRVRRKAFLHHSIGKLPLQSCVSHESRLFRLATLNVLNTKKPLLLNCLWIFSGAFMAIKKVIDSADYHWFAIEHFLNINVGQRWGVIWLKGTHQSVAA